MSTDAPLQSQPSSTPTAPGRTSEKPPYTHKVKIGRVPALDAGPITRFDGLADDQASRDLRFRIPKIHNPFLSLLILVGITIGCQMIAALIMMITMGPDRANEGVWGPVAIICVSITGYLLWTTLIERRRPPLELAPNRWVGLPLGLLAGALAFLLCYAVIWVLGGFDLTPASSVHWGEWWFQVLMVGAMAGISEEILFRGVLFRFVEQLVGTWVAIGVSGLVFGLVHLSNPDATWQGAIGIALEAGLFFGVVYALTRSLWVVIGIHAAWNIVQGPILGVFVSGTGDAASLLESRAAGSDLISGGIFGAEASVITVAIMLAVTIYLAIRLHHNNAVVQPMWVRRARQRRAMEAEAASNPMLEQPISPASAPQMNEPALSESERPSQP